MLLPLRKTIFGLSLQGAVPWYAGSISLFVPISGSLPSKSLLFCKLFEDKSIIRLFY